MKKKKLTEAQQQTLAKLQSFWAGSASASVMKDYENENVREIDLDSK